MTNDEKIKKFEEVQAALWGMALNGNLLQSTLAAGIIRQLKIESPEGDDPESA
jgi:hypothetical protein